MRNLRSVGHFFVGDLGDKRSSACAWDVSTDSVLCAYGPLHDNPQIQIKRWWEPTDAIGELPTIASWDALPPTPDLDCDQILDLHYFADAKVAFLVLKGGDLLLVRESPLPGEEKIEIVGSVDAGILSAAWSPDEELLALVSKADTLIFMSRDFESVASASFSEQDLQASKHVAVGWGKAETQFKGKGAKALKDPTIPDKVDEGLASHADDGSATVSWRGDGAFVAINSFQASSRRVIRIFSRECELDGVSEPVDFLEAALAWRPAGNIIASVQRLDDQLRVVFFERNGLRHGEFGLRISKDGFSTWASSISLQWNCDSSILAVCFLDRVQLWTMGNYHYYLKQELFMSLSRQPCCPRLTWHSEDPLLAILATEGGFCRLEYAWRTCRGPISGSNDYGIIAVVDGSTLKLTPLRLANIPPPMAYMELECSQNIVDVTFLNSDSALMRFAVLQRTAITIFDWRFDDLPVPRPVLIASFTEGLPSNSVLKGARSPSCRQILFCSSSYLLVLGDDMLETYIYRFHLGEGILQLEDSFVKPSAKELLSFSHAEPATKFISFRNNTLARVDDCLDGPQTLDIRLPKGTESIWVAPHRNAAEPRSESALHPLPSQVTFALTKNGFLYGNELCLARDCTSFLVTNAHLIFTTSQHLLKFVHITDSKEFTVPPNAPEDDERCRRVERGARIVTVCPSTSALILQMPRGNLETIFPRALVLAEIRHNIGVGDYGKAFLSCRSHRVDMNILHDYDPQGFLAHVGCFIDQVRKVEYLDLFLSSSREENVAKTMYKDTLPTRALSTEFEIHSSERPPKVNAICDAFIVALKKRSPTNLQSIITAHVCKTPPDLEAGLREVSELQASDSARAEAAVEHVCFLVDVNKLYDAALGLYDLHLALLVAEQSQRDPREYMPFLQDLEVQPDLRMRFSIDDYLGRHAKALDHLAALNAFDELKTYTVRHKLYEKCLSTQRYKQNNLREVTRLYAEFLFQKSEYKDAAYAYEYLGDYRAASEAYQLAHLWQEALSCATLVPLEGERLRSFATSIVDSMVELKEYKAAAVITLDYLTDVEASARLFCRAVQFSEAIRLVALHDRTDLWEGVIDASLIESQGTTTELLADCRSQLEVQVPRLRELREKKLKDPSAFYGAKVPEGPDIPDNVSLAPTDASTMGASLFTRYTNNSGTLATNATRRSSKSRRREERKRAMGKRGSVYEEEYLVNSIRRLVDRVNDTRGDVQQMMLALVRRSMRERARAVEAAMVALVDLCRDSVQVVFENAGEGDRVESTTVNGFQGGNENTSAADGDEQPKTSPPPVVRPFARMPLLA